MLLSDFIQNFFTNVDLGLFLEFFIRLLLNTACVFILVHYIYYPANFDSNFLFNLPQMGIMVFLIASILNQIKMDFAIALGLFAVFSILRYRTVPVELKEMTYLFSVIAMSIINAIVVFQFSTGIGLLTSNVFILGFAYYTENHQPKKSRNRKLLTFEPSDFEILNDKNILLQEIKEKTKINLTKVKIVKINVIRNEVTVLIFFNN